MDFQFRILRAADEEKSHIDLEGKVIYGLHIEGARWAEEKGELDEALHKVGTNPKCMSPRTNDLCEFFWIYDLNSLQRKSEIVEI